MSGGGQDHAARRDVITDHLTIAQRVMGCGTQYELLRLEMFQNNKNDCLSCFFFSLRGHTYFAEHTVV